MLIGIILYWVVIILALFIAYVYSFCIYTENNEKYKTTLISKILMFSISFIPIFGLIVNTIILAAFIPLNARIGGIFKFFLKKS